MKLRIITDDSHKADILNDHIISPVFTIEDIHSAPTFDKSPYPDHDIQLLINIQYFQNLSNLDVHKAPVKSCHI